MRVRVVMTALVLCSCTSDPERSAGGAGDGQQPDGAGRSDAGGRSGSGGAAASGGGGVAAGGTGARGSASGNGAMNGDDAGMAGRDAAMDDGAAGADADAPSVSCLDGIANYTASGPFAFESVKVDQVNVWVPDVPAGCKVPVVHFANATASVCASFSGITERLASHGFLTACYENANQFDGTYCLDALRTVFDAYADLAAMKIGSTGQEAGGDAAIACIHLAEQEWGDTAFYAGHAVAPFVGTGSHPGWQADFAQITSPVFMFNGSEDSLVSESSVRMAYDALAGDKYWYEATDATHVPVPVSWAAESAVVFFRWKLLGDQAAGDYFAAMPETDRWDLQQQDPAP